MSDRLRYIGDTMESLSARGYERYKASLLPSNTPCVVTIGTIGKLCLTRQDSFCNQAVNAIIVDQIRHDPLYVYYLMKLIVPRVKSLSSGTASGRENVSKGVFENIPLRVHPLSMQKEIAAILSAYDDLIENNTRRIKILEEMAQMLYREWFVSFRFPGREKHRLKNSKMGSIPEGWYCLSCTEAVEIDPLTIFPREGVKPFVPMGSLSPTSMLISDIEEREGNSGSKFKNGDTLFARITPCLENGKTGFVQFLPTAEAVAFGSTEFLVLRSRTVCPEYVYLMARSEEFRNNAIKSMSGATGRQRVQQACFDKFFIAHPPVDLLKHFQAMVFPIFQLVHNLNLKSTNLRKTRDLLLPKLISGEVSIAQLETEAVAQNA
jgi:type I restriction enzyme S subunit